MTGEERMRRALVVADADQLRARRHDVARSTSGGLDVVGFGCLKSTPEGTPEQRPVSRSCAPSSVFFTISASCGWLRPTSAAISSWVQQHRRSAGRAPRRTSQAAPGLPL